MGARGNSFPASPAKVYVVGLAVQAREESSPFLAESAPIQIDRGDCSEQFVPWSNFVRARDKKSPVLNRTDVSSERRAKENPVRTFLTGFSAVAGIVSPALRGRPVGAGTTTRERPWLSSLRTLALLVSVGAICIGAANGGKDPSPSVRFLSEDEAAYLEGGDVVQRQMLHGRFLVLSDRYLRRQRSSRLPEA